MNEDRDVTLADLEQMGRNDAVVMMGAMLPAIDESKGRMSDQWSAMVGAFFAEQVNGVLGRFREAGLTNKEIRAYHKALKSEWDKLLDAAFAPYMKGN